ncbi:hypothetical protein ABPG75_006636 [Micractinium tetrahymenae]
MSAPWAELCTRLGALLQRFSAGPAAAGTAAAGEQLLENASRCWQLCSDPALRAPPPAAAERAQALQLLRRLGPALAAWDAPLQRHLSTPSALLNASGAHPAQAVCLFLAACTAADAVLRAVQLQQSAAPLDDSVHAWLGRSIAAQASLLSALLEAAGAAGIVAAVAAMVLPPDGLVSWLHAAAGALLSMPLASCVGCLGLPPGLGPVLLAAFHADAFRRHRELLTEQAAAAGRLASLLLRSLGMAAVVLRLPPGRQPEGLAWDSGSRLTALLASGTLRPALAQQVGWAEDAAALRLLRRAAAVLEQLPAGCPQGCAPAAVLEQHVAAAELRALIAEDILPRGDAATLQAARLVPTVTPQLTAALRLVPHAAGEAPAATIGMLVAACRSLLASLQQSLVAVPISSPGLPSAPQLWGAAGEALHALSLLPAAVQAEAATSRQAPQTAQILLQLASRLVCTAWKSASTADPAQAAALAASAGQMHEACCRCIHWAGRAPQELCLLLPEAEQALHWQLLLGLLSMAMQATAEAHERLAEAEADARVFQVPNY